MVRAASSLVIWSFVALVPTGLVWATDFRIASDVFVGGESEAVSRNVTLFRAGLVYDYLTAPQSVTVFDPIRGRFVLIDPVHRIQTQMPTREVATFNEELKLRASGAKDPLLQFMANPEFKTTTPQPNVIYMAGPNMSYRIATLTVKDKGALKQYIEFSDWYARLNTLVNPGSPPPFSRIAINQTLYKRGEIPREVELAIKPSQAIAGAGEVKLRSTHEISWKLLGEDLRRIEETGEQLATFEQVGFDEFIQAGQQKEQAEAQQAAVAERPSETKRR